MEIEFLMKVTFLEQLIHFSEHYRALRLHQLKTAGGSLFLAVGKSETAHRAGGPTTHVWCVYTFVVGMPPISQEHQMQPPAHHI